MSGVLKADESRWAIGLTFHVPRRDRRSFRSMAARTLMPQLIALHDAGRIAAVLPFRHRALKTRGEAAGTSWSDYWVLVVASEVDPDEIWTSICMSVGIAAKPSPLGFLRAEILRPQPGMQMYYPRRGGLQQEARLWHWIEYAVSRPDARAAYYQDQYRFSAPSIRRFYEAGAVGRVIGFEVARVLQNRGALPAWDVIHITGAMHFLKIAWVLWRQMPVFNSFARNAGYSSALDVVRSWDAQREKYQIHAVQDRTSTLQPMNGDRYPLHHRSEVDVATDAHSLFAHLDDHRRLAGHMEKPSLMMAGATMRVEPDALQGQAVGSVIRVVGRVLGVDLAVEEVVTERVPSLRKTWETRGEPRLLVIGSYRMGFTISPQGERSRLVVFIDYQLPSRGVARGLALLFGRAYAAWCTRRMATDAEAAFAGVAASREIGKAGN